MLHFSSFVTNYRVVYRDFRIIRICSSFATQYWCKVSFEALVTKWLSQRLSYQIGYINAQRFIVAIHNEKKKKSSLGIVIEKFDSKVNIFCEWRIYVGSFLMTFKIDLELLWSQQIISDGRKLDQCQRNQETTEMLHSGHWRSNVLGYWC